MKMTTKMNATPCLPTLNRMLAALLSLAILAAAAANPGTIRTPTMIAGGPSADVRITDSNVLPDLKSLTGGELPPKDCALYLAGVGLGLVAGAIAIGATLGAATPFVMGMALYGSLLPTAAVAC